MREIPRARLVAYGVAVLATSVAFVVRLALVPLVGYHTPYLTFVPAVMLSAYLGGLRPGLLATALSAAAARYFFSGVESAVSHGVRLGNLRRYRN